MAQNSGSSTAIVPDPEENMSSVSAGNAAADSKEQPKAGPNQLQMLAEKKRRDRERNYFDELRALMPHVTDKSHKKAVIVGHAINYIQSLEKTKAMLEKRKQEMALARQVASSSSAPPPQAAEGTPAAILSSDVVVADVCHDDDEPAPPPLQQPVAAAVPMSADDIPQPLAMAAAVPAPPPPQLPKAAAGQVVFQTWSWRNLVLNVSNGNAYINVCAPRHLASQTMVMVVSVLNKHGIDVVMAQVDSDDVRTVLNIFARVTRMGGENSSSEDVYKLAMSEILLFLNAK